MTRSGPYAPSGRLAARWGSLAGVVAVADAKHTQHKLIEQVGAVGGWWLLPVKANQPSILAKIRALPWAQIPAEDTCRGKAHGRAETRTIRVVQTPKHVDLALAHTAQVIKITRHTHRRPHPVRWAIANWPEDAERGAVSRFCERHEISRSVFYKIRRLAREVGPVGATEPGSRRPTRALPGLMTR